MDSPGTHETGHPRIQAQGTKWFHSGGSTVDRVLALDILAQKRREEFWQPLYVAYVDLKAAFDSIDRNALYQLLRIVGVPEKLLSLFCSMYTGTISCVRCEGETGLWFNIDSRVRQGCVLAPDTFAVGIDRAVGRTAARAMFGVSVGESSFTDFSSPMMLLFFLNCLTCYSLL